jgi:hypothetical protein
MAVLDLQGMELKASVSSTGARNSGASKGCPVNGGKRASFLSLLLC